VAGALEDLYPERVDEQHAVLAHHYRLAEAWPEVLVHARQAAEAAHASYANREALEHYSLALMAAQRTGRIPSEQLHLYEARAAVYEITGEFEPARADYEAALVLARADGNAIVEARLLGALGMLWGGHQDYQRGLQLVQQAVSTAEISR
jgi:tetratricopeptide (TPR) repeat protein